MCLRQFCDGSAILALKNITNSYEVKRSNGVTRCYSVYIGVRQTCPIKTSIFSALRSPFNTPIRSNYILYISLRTWHWYNTEAHLITCAVAFPCVHQTYHRPVERKIIKTFEEKNDASVCDDSCWLNFLVHRYFSLWIFISFRLFPFVQWWNMHVSICWNKQQRCRRVSW